MGKAITIPDDIIAKIDAEKAKIDAELVDVGEDKRCRGPDEPTSTEKEKIRRARKAPRVDDDIPAEPVEIRAEVAREPVRNPRLDNTIAARDQRRREIRWKAREKRYGMPQRREIFDSNGNPTGGTTNNLR